MIGIDRSYVDINILKYFEMCNMQIYVKGFCTDKPMYASLSLSLKIHILTYLDICTYIVYIFEQSAEHIQWIFSYNFQGDDLEVGKMTWLRNHAPSCIARNSSIKNSRKAFQRTPGGFCQELWRWKGWFHPESGV